MDFCYQIYELIGEGSFGKVYSAKCQRTNNLVAYKVISKNHRQLSEIASIKRECEIQKELQHPNVIKMLHSFETINELVIITEFAEKDLCRVLKEEGVFPENEAKKIICDLVSALYYLHSNRILHRDLKPQNVLLDSNGVAKLCDFGFAKILESEGSVFSSIKGTPLYMAPELMNELPYGYSADLWSLGCIAYELVTGHPPYATTSILQLIRMIKTEPIKWPYYLSKCCLSFLKGLLQKNPTHRLSWQQLLNHQFVFNYSSDYLTFNGVHDTSNFNEVASPTIPCAAVNSSLQFNNVQLTKLVSSAAILLQHFYDVVPAENKIFIDQWFCYKHEYDETCMENSQDEIEDDNIPETNTLTRIEEVSENEKEEVKSSASPSFSSTISDVCKEDNNSLKDNYENLAIVTENHQTNYVDNLQDIGIVESLNNQIYYLQDIRRKLFVLRENLNAQLKNDELRSNTDMNYCVKVDVAFEIIDSSMEMKNLANLGQNVHQLYINDEVDKIIYCCLNLLSIDEMKNLFMIFLRNIIETRKCGVDHDDEIINLNKKIDEFKYLVWRLVQTNTKDQFKETKALVPGNTGKNLKYLQNTSTSSSGTKVTLDKKKLIIEIPKS